MSRAAESARSPSLEPQVTFSNGKLGARGAAATAAEAIQRKEGGRARPISVTAQIQLSQKTFKLESTKLLKYIFFLTVFMKQTTM